MFKLRSLIIFGMLLACFVLVSVEAKRCDCAAIELYKPVCGSDGQTYGNSGKLQCHNKCNGKHVTIVHQGACRKG